MNNELIPFVKMQGTGNDFIIIEREHVKHVDINSYSRFLNDRHFGIGGDGLIIIDKSNDLYKMTMINPDGSEAMCGNGIRCFALYLLKKGFISGNEFKVDSIAGVKSIKYEDRNGRDYFSVNMGVPILERSLIPVAGTGPSPVLNLEVQADGKDYLATCVSMGNPHTVIFLNSYENIDVHIAGAQIEQNPIFPERTNVEFIKVVDRNNVMMRVWERGAGETLACGTGTCAAVVASNLQGYVDDFVKVNVPGGIVEINYSGKDVIMTGEAAVVFEGNFNLEKIKEKYPEKFNPELIKC